MSVPGYDICIKLKKNLDSHDLTLAHYVLGTCRGSVLARSEALLPFY